MKNFHKSCLAVVAISQFFNLPLQAWVGGPWDPQGGSDNNIVTVGTYSGTFIPTTTILSNAEVEELDQTIPIEPEDLISYNSMGLFLVAVPAQGAVEGAAVLFSNGFTFVGPIIGLADNNKGQLFGVIDLIGTVGVVVTSGTTTTTFVNVASGRIIANAVNANNISSASSSIYGSSTPNNSLLGYARITVRVVGGTATTTDFLVDGVLQSSVTGVPTFPGITAAGG